MVFDVVYINYHNDNAIKKRNNVIYNNWICILPNANDWDLQFKEVSHRIRLSIKLGQFDLIFNEISITH